MATTVPPRKRHVPFSFLSIVGLIWVGLLVWGYNHRDASPNDARSYLYSHAWLAIVALGFLARGLSLLPSRFRSLVRARVLAAYSWAWQLGGTRGVIICSMMTAYFYFSDDQRSATAVRNRVLRCAHSECGDHVLVRRLGFASLPKHHPTRAHGKKKVRASPTICGPCFSSVPVPAECLSLIGHTGFLAPARTLSWSCFGAVLRF